MKVGHSSFSQCLPQARHCVGAGAQWESAPPAFDLKALAVLWEWHKQVKKHIQKSKPCEVPGGVASGARDY